MKRWLPILAVGASIFALGGPAAATPGNSGGAAEEVQKARREGKYEFCSKPKTPLRGHQEDLCALATEVDDCDGYIAACKNAKHDDVKKDAPSEGAWRWVLDMLGALARGLVWLLVLLVIGAIAFPLIRAILKARREKALADAPKAPNVASLLTRAPPPEPETISDAEAALREADEHARRGDLVRALSLYLAASLAALDRRGAIRLARHRTNGEYVRACAGDESQQPLREIVREVDKVEFGKIAPTSESVARVAARASKVVLLVAALALMGCGGARGPRTVDDPAGDQLPIDVLRRVGYTVSYLDTSLAAMPLPEPGNTSPIVVVDVQRVAIEEESELHLLRWVEEGGVLVLFGSPTRWPKVLHADQLLAPPGQVDIVTTDVFARGAHVGLPWSVKWPDSEPIAWIGKSVYAAHIHRGKGGIIGVAGDALFTNVGVARPDNAAAFVAFLDIAVNDRRSNDEARGVTPPASTFEVRVARAADGIPPPSNPFSALVQAGLGKGSWHALAGAVILFLAFGIRHARARPAAPAARRAFAEHVEATGAFYGRARALGHALASYGRFAEMRLRERVPRGMDPVQFLATRAKVPAEDAARVWKRATEATAEDPPRGDELATIRDLGSMLAKALETG